MVQNNYPGGQHLQGLWNLPHKSHLYLIPEIILITILKLVNFMFVKRNKIVFRISNLMKKELKWNIVKYEVIKRYLFNQSILIWQLRKRNAMSLFIIENDFDLKKLL